MGKKKVKPAPVESQEKSSWNTAAFLILVFLVAYVPRFAFAFGARKAGLTYDEADYDMLARNLALGNGYVFSDFQTQNVPVTFRPPGYPFFLSLIYFFFDRIGPYYYNPNMAAVFAARVAQAIVGAFVPVLAYFLGAHIFSRRVGVIAAIVMTLYATFIFFTSALMTENLYIPSLMVVLLLFLKSEGKRPLLFCTLGAIAMGLATHVRPELIGFLPFLFVWFYLVTRNWKQTFQRWGLVAAIVIVMVTPWSVRNYRIVDQFIFLDARTGYNLYIGYHDGADGSFSLKAATTLVQDLPQDRTGKWELIRHNWGKEQAVKFIRENPGRAIALLPLKFLHFWDLDKREYLFAYSYGYIGELPRPVLALLFALIMLPFAFIVIFGVIGVLFTRPTPNGVWLFLLLILLYTIGHTLVFGEPRMHMPLVPLIAVCAAQGLAMTPGLVRRWRGTKTETEMPSRKRVIAAGAIVCGFILLWSYGFYLSKDKFAKVFGPDGHRTHIEF